jgi:hypothetical protein
MRQVIERVTCDVCGQVFDFEKYNTSTRLVRIEDLSRWISSRGWKCRPFENTKFQMRDTCPNCPVLGSSPSGTSDEKNGPLAIPGR